MKITTKFMLALALVGSVVFTSCKDYDEDNYNNAVLSNTKLASALNEQIDALEQEVAAIKSCNCKPKELADSIIAVAENKIAAAKVGLINSQEFNDSLDTLKKHIVILNNTASEIKALAQNDSTVICKFFGVGNLAEAIQKLNNGQILAYSQMINLINTKADSARVYKAINTKADSAAVYKKIGDECKALLDSIDSVAVKVKANTNSIAALEKAYQKADSLLGKRIDSLCKVCDTLNIRLNRVEDVLAKQVTGIIVQSVYNPAFGSYSSILSNVQTNTILAYVADDKNVMFPLVEKVADAAKHQEIVLNPDTLNAGTLYLTINPNTRDFTGLKGLTLVNSLDEESAFELGLPQKSEKLLTVGVTRSANNGFYEMPVKIAKAKALIKDVNYVDLGEKLSDFSGCENLQDIAKKSYKAISELSKIQAEGVKCAWTDSLGDHAVYSNYNIAAVKVKPLGFNNDEAIDKIFQNAKDYIKKANDKVVKKICDKLDNEKKYYQDKLNARGIDSVWYNDGLVVIKINVLDENNEQISAVMSGLEKILIADPTVKGKSGVEYATIVYQDRNGNVVSAAKATNAIVTLSPDETDDLIAAYAASDVSIITQMANKLLNEINTYEKDLKDGTYYDKMWEYVDKYVKARVKKMFIPTIYVSSSNGYSICGTAGAPTKAKGDVEILPSTYSFELAAPVRAKYVRIVNSKGVKTFESIYTTKEKINVTSYLSEGLNTITYCAMDYSGNQEVSDYYITLEK